MNPIATEMTANGTRDRLIESARVLFHERGYHATSLAMVLERAEVNSGSLYYFFKTKEALLAAVLDRYTELLRPLVLEPAFARSDDPIQRVFHVLEGYRRMLIETDFAIGCPIGSLALELTATGQPVLDGIALNFSNWSAAIEGCLGDAAERLDPDCDRAALSRFVLTVMEGAVVLARGHRSIEPFDDAIRQLRDYFERLDFSRTGEE